MTHVWDLFHTTRRATSWSIDLESFPVVAFFWAKFLFIPLRTFFLNDLFILSLANIWLTESSRRERDWDATVVSTPERILRDGRRIVAAPNATIPVGNRPSAPQLPEVSLEEVATTVYGTEGKDMLDGHVARPVLEERPASKTRSTQSRSSERLEDTVHD